MGWFGDILPAVVGLGGAALNVWGNERAAGQQSDAIERATAAQIAADERALAARIAAEERARAEYREAAARGIGAIRAGTGRYAETVAPMMAVNNRGLTDSQEIELEDLHRYGTATLAASGLRGAGRAGVASIQDTRRRAVADMYDRNRSRIDSARSGLANIYADEGRAVANTEIGAGNQLGGSFSNQGAATAGNISGQGQAAAAGISNMGATRAGATLGNASTIGTTLGSVGAIIADSQKRGRYDGYSQRAV